MHAIVMAGGRGERLKPLTLERPKPLIEINGTAVIVHVLRHLLSYGVRSATMMTGYLGDMIERYLGSGEQLGMELSYVREMEPLGTAGALRLLDRPAEPVLITNCDVINDVDVHAMCAGHIDRDAVLSVMLCRRQFTIPFGVIRTDEASMVQVIKEKPKYDLWVSGGIYLLSPEAFSFLPRHGRYDMPDLITAVLESGHRVYGFQHRGEWFDVGTFEQLREVSATFQERELANRPTFVFGREFAS